MSRFSVFCLEFRFPEGTPCLILQHILIPPGVEKRVRAADTQCPAFLTLPTKGFGDGLSTALATILAAHELNIDAILQEPGFPSAARPFVAHVARYRAMSRSAPLR